MVSEVEKSVAEEEVVAMELLAPPGWKKQFFPKRGGTPMKTEIVFTSPTGEEIHNQRQLQQYLKSHPGGPPASKFDWGTGETPRRSARISEKVKSSPESEPPLKKGKRSSASKKDKVDSVDGEASAEEKKKDDDFQMVDAENAEEERTAEKQDPDLEKVVAKEDQPENKDTEDQPENKDTANQPENEDTIMERNEGALEFKEVAKEDHPENKEATMEKKEGVLESKEVEKEDTPKNKNSTVERTEDAIESKEDQINADEPNGVKNTVIDAYQETKHEIVEDVKPEEAGVPYSDIDKPDGLQVPDAVNIEAKLNKDNGAKDNGDVETGKNMMEVNMNGGESVF